MLDFIYYAISAVLWFWHKVFSYPLGADSALSWILAIMFLTFTLRVLLFKPMVNQIRSSAKMQKMAPKMQEIRQKYKNDQQKMMEETRKLQKEMGVNPMLGCLPALAQMPVFIGLFHVLRSFNRTGTSAGGLGMTVEQNRMTPNYLFGVDEVGSFLDANLFGVPLSSYISMPADMYAAFPTADGLSRMRIMLLAIPLILIIAFATHMNARQSVNRMEARRASGKVSAPATDQMAMQTNMMNKMMLWIMPGTILVTGVFWHIGLLFYMVANNVWTFFQQRYIFSKLDREEDAEEAAVRAAKRATAPRPGQKPNRDAAKKNQQAAAAPASSAPATPAPEAADGTPDAAPQAANKPQPGQRPNNPKNRGKKKKRR